MVLDLDTTMVMSERELRVTTEAVEELEFEIVTLLLICPQEESTDKLNKKLNLQLKELESFMSLFILLNNNP